MTAAPPEDGSPPPDAIDAPKASPRRWPLLVVVLGALGLVQLFERLTPKDRAVSLRFESPADVRRVELTWLDGDGEVLASSRWAFDNGAPRRLSTHVRARRGEYRARIAVERRDASATDAEHRVRFEGAEETTVAVP